MFVPGLVGALAITIKYLRWTIRLIFLNSAVIHFLIAHDGVVFIAKLYNFFGDQEKKND